jgi:hypothetical protein
MQVVSWTLPWIYFQFDLLVGPDYDLSRERQHHPSPRWLLVGAEGAGGSKQGGYQASCPLQELAPQAYGLGLK